MGETDYLIGDFVISGGALDVLYKLHFFGPQDDGDLPSKGGMAELMRFKLATSNYNKPPANRITVLGKALALEYPWRRPPKQEDSSDG